MDERLQSLLQLELDSVDNSEEENLGEPLDLRCLLAEMTALKAEVRSETKEFRELRMDLDRREGDKATQREKERSLQRSAARALIDVSDRLQAGIQNTQLPAPRWFHFRSQPHAILKALVEGLTLSIQRIEEALSDLGIERIQTLEQSFDPHSMEALQISYMEGKAEGLVLEEIRSGYHDAQGVLRVAQVVVNRRRER